MLLRFVALRSLPQIMLNISGLGSKQDFFFCLSVLFIYEIESWQQESSPVAMTPLRILTDIYQQIGLRNIKTKVKNLHPFSSDVLFCSTIITKS